MPGCHSAGETPQLSCLLIGLGGWSLFNYYSNDTRAPWRNVATDIGELAKPDDLLLIGADFCKRDVFDYGSSLPQRIIGISRESDSLTADLRQSLISTNKIFTLSHRILERMKKSWWVNCQELQI
ncbi:MAG: hypothetical protein R3C26_10380 [Calditrichia bacterium]